MAKAISVSIRLTGAVETLAAFRRLPKAASDALRNRSQALASVLVGRIVEAAQADSPQSALMAPTVKARRDRIPSIEAGGSKHVGRHGTPAYKILFGSEFGSTRYRQFRPHVGKGSYWLLKTVGAQQSAIAESWSKAAADIARDFSEGGAL